MTQQTFKAFEFIKYQNLDYALWDIVHDGRTARMYTMREEDEIIVLPAHVAIWFTDESVEEEDWGFLESAPFVFITNVENKGKENEYHEKVAIFPIELTD